MQITGSPEDELEELEPGLLKLAKNNWNKRGKPDNTNNLTEQRHYCSCIHN